MKARLAAALLACGAATAAIPAAAEIALFGRENFEGRNFATEYGHLDLREEGFNDRASSAIVTGRPWEVCADVEFQGRCRVLQPGRYPDLRSMGMNDSISSFRPLRRDVRYNRDRYAPPAPYPVYDARRRAEERLFEADVIAVRAVYGQPQQRCWVEREAVGGSPRGNEVGGAVIGGILGGVLGHQVGSGRGNDVATGVGAVVGALAGANVARDRAGAPVYTQDVRRCTSGAPSDRPEYYDVTYRFRGQEHRMQTTAPPPPTITVNGRGEPRIG